MQPAHALGPPAGRVVPGVERIAVPRANLLGDLVMTLPALEALRSTYPSAELVLLGTPMHAELLADRFGRPCPHREPWLTDVPAGGVLADALDLLDLGVGDQEPTGDDVRLTHAPASPGP